MTQRIVLIGLSLTLLAGHTPPTHTGSVGGLFLAESLAPTLLAMPTGSSKDPVIQAVKWIEHEEDLDPFEHYNAASHRHYRNDVYKGTHPDTLAAVILKVSPFSIGTAGLSNSEEVRILKQLNALIPESDRRLPRLLAYGHQYLVTDYFYGESLYDFLKGNPKFQDFNPTLRIFALILEAVTVLHQHDFSHGDLKPKNILISPATNQPTEIRLVDLEGSFNLRSDRARTIPLSEDYAAPELKRVLRSIADKRADVYSLGKILYDLIPNNFKMVTPFRSDRTKQQQSLRKAIQALIREATDLDPLKRYADAQEFLEAVRQVQSDYGMEFVSTVLRTEA